MLSLVALRSQRPREIWRAKAALAYRVLALRIVSFASVGVLLAAGCGSAGEPDGDSAGESAEATTTTEPAVDRESTVGRETGSLPTGEGQPALDPESLASLYEGVGDPDAKTVVVYAQGGPVTELSEDELREVASASGLEDGYVVAVHQAQTLNPEDFLDADLDFEQAKAASAETVAMMADVVDFYLAEKRDVYVVGSSFGAFVVQDLLATQGNLASGYLILTGRLDMPEQVWAAFSQGRAAGFADGTEIVEFEIEEAGMGAGTPAGDRNMARLAAGLGYKRFTELLDGVDLSNTVYVYGQADEQVGRLTAAEVEFLEDHGARVVSDPGGHDIGGDRFASELMAMLGTKSSVSAAAVASVELPRTGFAEGEALLADSYVGAFVFAGDGEHAFEEIGFESELDPGDLPAPIDSYLPAPALVGLAGDTIVVVPVDLATESPAGAVLVVHEGRFLAGVDDIEFDRTDDGFVSVAGALTDLDAGSETDFAAVLGFGIGSSVFEIDGTQARVAGTLGGRTYVQLQYLLEAHPEVDTLVLQSIQGSEDDDVNVQTGRLVRAAGMTTLVPADGEIYSGGVDLFAAGAVRIAEDGATLGVHSWCCAESGEPADRLSHDSPEHDTQLAYFTEMLGEELGRQFYFFTLQAATFDGIEAMTRTEMDLFGLLSADDVLGAATDHADGLVGLSAASHAELADLVIASIEGDYDIEGDSEVEGDVELLVVIDAAPAAIIVSITGFKDDSVAGEIVTVEVEPGAGGWMSVAALSNTICARGIIDGVCV